MGTIDRIFKSSPKDERITAQLGPIYKIGFYIMFFGILFDLYTRFNYLAQTDAGGGALGRDSVELAVLILACVVVAAMMARRGVYSDSLRFAEARSFGQTGLIAPSIGIGALIAAAAVGGRLYHEVALFGWGEVTWLGDGAMFVVLLAMFSLLALAVQYLTWRSYRRREDQMEEEGE